LAGIASHHHSPDHELETMLGDGLRSTSAQSVFTAACRMSLRYHSVSSLIDWPPVNCSAVEFCPEYPLVPVDVSKIYGTINETVLIERLAAYAAAWKADCEPKSRNAVR
jgi:hypothetical protein